MSLQKICDIPDVNDGAPDYVFMFGQSSLGGEANGLSMYLCYEAQRDFLSAPRRYSILRFDGSEVGDVSVGIAADYECLDAHQSLPARGLYRFRREECSEQGLSEPTIFIMGEQIIQVFCTECVVAETLYHQPSAQAALTHFLNAAS